MKKIFLLLFLIPLYSFGQTFKADKFGLSVGLLINVGTHVNNIGISLNSYYQDHFYQINAGSTITFNKTSYGKRKNFWESRNSLGLLILGGKKEMLPDFQLNSLLHNSTSNYGLGYNYIWYFDNIKTSQLSGGWGIHLKSFSLLLENDIFGGQGKDRFRTGHITMNYRMKDFKVTAGLNIWTGETANSTWNKGTFDKCPSGYRELENLPYGKTSHGILYGGLTYNLGYGQFTSMRIGVDSEKIRHSFQNRMMHDLIFLPKQIERKTPHYPRLDEFGCPVFEDSSVRKSKFYYQHGINENWSN
ncbi:MAG: hypothetical protein RI883_56 [Bacteroidota bacterium]